MSDLTNNLTARNVSDILNLNNANLAQSIQRLSTGLRINTPADDVAGNAIASRLQAQLATLQQGTLNAQDLISVAQTAQGALGQIGGIFQNINTLAAEATNGILSPQDRQDIQTQVNQLVGQINQIAGSTNFAGVPLLTGGIASPEQAVPSTINVTGNAFIGARSEPLVANITVNPAELNPSSGTSAFQNEAFQLQIVQNGASAISVNVTASGNPNVIVASVGVNLAAPPTSPVALTIPSSAPGGATFVANLNFENLTPTDIPNLVGQNAFISTTAFQPAITANNALAVQVGANVGETAQVGIPSALASNFLQGQNINVGTPLEAQGALVQIQQALGFVAQSQGVVAAFQNSAQVTIQNNNVLNENLLAAGSRITDINVAAETTNLVRNQILTQVSTATLAQANLIPQSILKLF